MREPKACSLHRPNRCRTPMDPHPAVGYRATTVRHMPVTDTRRTPMRDLDLDARSTARHHPITSRRPTPIRFPPAMARPQATVSHHAQTCRHRFLLVGCHQAMAHRPSMSCRRDTVHHLLLMSGHPRCRQGHLVREACDLGAMRRASAAPEPRVAESGALCTETVRL
jgi:hypothetical protein